MATFIYIAYAASSPAGPSGGSAIGLAFGIAGFAFMIFAGLLGARKKVPVWRVGRAQTWMRGHLWLGLLSLPLIFFHAGFQFGGVLTEVLMTLLIIVVASGLVGAALQHYMPRMMTSEIPMETIFEQIDHVREQLIVEADALVHAVCGPAQTESVAFSGAGGGAVAIATAAPAAVMPLRDFYTRQLRPFLKHQHLRNQPLARRDESLAHFRCVAHFASRRCAGRRQQARRNLRRGAPVAASGSAPSLVAWLADVAHTVVAGAAVARMHSRHHGVAILKPE